MTKVDKNAIDFDGPEDGDCSGMNLRDMGISVYDDLIIKYVSFNHTNSTFYNDAAAVKPMSKWIYLDLFKTLDDFSEAYPVDVVVVARGKVDALCPAMEFM